MGACDNIEVDLRPVSFDVAIITDPCFDVDIVQTNVTMAATTLAGQGPPGTAATITAGTTTTSAPGGNANVVNVGDQYNAVFDFIIPTGLSGPPGPMGSQGPGSTVNAGTTTTLAPGAPASVSNSGTATAAVFDFGIPQGVAGPAGAPGAAGSAATINVGTTSTLAPGSNATVLNTGTTSAAVFNFGIPAGVQGATGATGLQGPPGPAGSAGISTNANNKATLGSDSLFLVQGTATGVAATTHAQTVSGDDPQLTNARAPTAHATTHVTGGNDIIVPASASTAGLLKQLSGSTGDFVDGTNTCQNLVTAIQPTIWSSRLRSYNALGNPNFEIDQRNAGTLLSNPANLIFALDRWRVNKAGTMGISTQQLASGSGALLPGTNFRISQSSLSLTLTAQEASLAAGDFWSIQQFIEGPSARELYNDVSSVSLLVQSSVAGLKFGVALRDATPAYNLTKLCTIPTANTWTLIQLLPNIPVFPSGGAFNLTPGTVGYQLVITLAAGSTFTAPANDVWNTTGGFLGASGQDNFASKPLNSTFQILFVQHEPGGVCTTLIDKPFSQNYDECLRCYTKSYDYDVAIGSASAQAGMLLWTPLTTTGAEGIARYPRPMAKIPAVTIYNPVVGTINSLRHTSGTDYTVSSVASIGKAGFENLGTSAAMPALAVGQGVRFHYIADTGL